MKPIIDLVLHTWCGDYVLKTPAGDRLILCGGFVKLVKQAAELPPKTHLQIFTEQSPVAAAEVEALIRWHREWGVAPSAMRKELTWRFCAPQALLPIYWRGTLSVFPALNELLVSQLSEEPQKWHHLWVSVEPVT